MLSIYFNTHEVSQRTVKRKKKKEKKKKEKEKKEEKEKGTKMWRNMQKKVDYLKITKTTAKLHHTKPVK